MAFLYFVRFSSGCFRDGRILQHGSINELTADDVLFVHLFGIVVCSHCSLSHPLTASLASIPG